ncbi:MAG: glycosyltransferase [Pseudomonadota bacterium]
MRITLVDDSIPFDGYSASSRPLGAPQKAFALLAPALAVRGHEVRAFNRCPFKVIVEGSHWETWEGERPQDTDVLIAQRLPHLLDFVPRARKRFLWASGSQGLDAPAAQAVLARHRPEVVLWSEAERAQWSNPLGLATHVIAPGLAPAYLEPADVEDEPIGPADPPRAISTTHPLDGLDWLLALWVERIRPQAPAAELHVYSALLDKGQLGGTVPGTVTAVLGRALSARVHGVVIARPQADPQMAAAYRCGRVHLYPAAAAETFAATLAESQATGLPAVARAQSLAVLERVIDGQTGVIAASDANFAVAAVNLLTDRVAFERMSANARRLRRARGWAVAAAEWEERFA